MATIRELIIDAFELFGAYGAGEDPSDDDVQSAFRSYVAMREQMANERLLHASLTVAGPYTWEAGTASKTIGLTGNFPIAKPLQISSAFVRIDGTNDYQLRVITQQDYSDLLLKQQETSIPGCVYYNPGNTNITGTLYLWPIPDQDVEFSVMFKGSLFNPGGSLYTANSLFVDPEGTREMVTYNLAVRLAPKFGKEVPASVAKIAEDSIANIKRNNINMDEMYFPRGLGGPGGYWDPKTSWWA